MRLLSLQVFEKGYFFQVKPLDKYLRPPKMTFPCRSFGLILSFLAKEHMVNAPTGGQVEWPDLNTFPT